LLKNAKLKQQAAVEDIDYRHPRGLVRQAMIEVLPVFGPLWT
jgi:hypothetical protein